MYKRDKVKVTPDLINNGTFVARRPVTDEETRAWYDSDASKGMNSAGESKLPPRCMHVRVTADETFEVVRGRARATLGWGNPTPGLVMVERTSGEVIYFRRHELVLV